jgi:uncharacterized protein
MLDLSTNLILLAIGLAAGSIDSIVGGGGLIATPALMHLFPSWQILQVIGTNRTSSIAGTSVAAWNYFRQVSIPTTLVMCACVGALVSAYAGVQLAKELPQELLKQVVLGVIVLLAIYTVFKKDLGLAEKPHFDGKGELFMAFLVGSACGFYNGLIGPGTGTLLVFGFVSVLGMSFLRGSAMAKAANVSADLSSWLVLLSSGYVMAAAAIPLLVGNVCGSYLGSQLAIRQGSAFIRWVFLAIVLALVVKLGWR